MNFTCKLCYGGVILLLLLSGCKQEVHIESDIVARVGDRVLSTSEVSAWEASLHQPEVPAEVRYSYIRHWVEEELLYQSALDNGLLNDPWVVQRVEEITRSLMVSRLLEKETAQISRPTPSVIQNYFEKAQSEFVWPSIHLVVEFWHADDREGMERLRKNIQRGRLTGLWAGDERELQNGKISIDGEGNASPDVWKIVSRLNIGQVSQVVNILDSYWVFKLVDRREAGEPQGLDDVLDEIVLRIMEESRKNVRDEFVKALVEKNRRAGKLYLSEPSPTVAIVDKVNDDNLQGE